MTWETVWRVVHPTNVAEFWGMILALGTVGLCVVGLRGLNSLKLARTEMKNRATRDAKQCAVDRCEQFAQKIIQENREILAAMAQRRIPVFVKAAEEVTFGDENEKAMLAGAEAWMAALPAETYAQCAKLLNQLEAWAMPFTHALADSDVAFAPCAAMYCSIVMQLYAMLVSLRARDGSGHYPNVVLLFQAWYGSKAEEGQKVEAAKLLAQLNEVQTKGPPKVRLQTPIGTDIVK